MMARSIRGAGLPSRPTAGHYRAAGEAARNPAAPQRCDACFTGDYPTRLTDREGASEVRQLNLLAETA